MKKIFITGGTGYVGRKIVKLLLDKGYRVTCLVRMGSENKINIYSKVNIVFGDALDIGSIDLSGHDVVIHLVAIIKEVKSEDITFERLNFHTAKNMIDKSISQGINRFLFMSAAGYVPGIGKGYFKYKLMAEDYLKQSGLKWTIFRPSLIYDKSIVGKSMGWVRMMKPLFNLGSHLNLAKNFIETWEPISKNEIAKAYIKAIEDDFYINKTLNTSELISISKH